MPIISMFFGIKITMYYNDHMPAHFHAEYNEHLAVVDIFNCCIIEGSLPSKQLKLVLAWTILHHDELMRNWKRSQEHDELIRIEPL